MEQTDDPILTEFGGEVHEEQEMEMKMLAFWSSVYGGKPQLILITGCVPYFLMWPVTNR